MVALPWRRLAHAARWKGHAAQRMTGAARVRLAHCQYVNCSAGTIDIAMTGTDRAAAPISLWRSPVSSGSGASSLGAPGVAAGAGRAAV